MRTCKQCGLQFKNQSEVVSHSYIHRRANGKSETGGGVNKETAVPVTTYPIMRVSHATMSLRFAQTDTAVIVIGDDSVSLFGTLGEAIASAMKAEEARAGQASPMVEALHA